MINSANSHRKEQAILAALYTKGAVGALRNMKAVHATQDSLITELKKAAAQRIAQF